MVSANEIRQQFIDFFVKKHGHTFVPSSSVIPHGDDTLLFANAGMNQFKPIFLGLEKRGYVRAANTQKCIPAGGKHNDLDDVGKDTYHHTFFEMLGNWSFGDYFKKEAIAWAWELLTDVWKLDPARLYVTVFEGDPKNGIPRDDEAAGFWKAVGAPEKHIHLGNAKDNFWEMGNTGPCGPCTEVHYDNTPDKSGGKLVNAGTDQVIEIWNLVFIQFNRNEDRSLTSLPAKHVDTGMGFERITKVIQGKSSNYDTDVFTPIIAAIQEVTQAAPYTGKLEDRKDTAYRVIADHIRSLTFALSDGGTPSNEGRGSVIRSILRRADLFGWLDFGMREPFLHKLVPAVVTHFGDAFPELKTAPDKVAATILDEEKGFLRTIERGLKLYEAAAKRAKAAGGVISAKDAFDLHAAQGFFVDITTKLAADAGLTVDRPGCDKLIEKFKKESGEGAKQVVVAAIKGELPKTDDSAKYTTTPLTTKVVGWVKDNTVFREGTIRATDTVALLLDKTNFYAEQGGQIGDIGRITAEGMVFHVEDTQRLGDSVLHRGVLTEGRITVGQTVTATVLGRANTVRNHTATHLMNLALREVLGRHVEQNGSLVDAEKTRFDFNHDKPLAAEEIKRVEEIVNGQILRDLPVTAITMPLADAKTIPGVRAVFGEKYPDPVRVVLIGADSAAAATADMSVEFCGGTHLNRTSQAGLFKIVAQENVAKGVRRVTAVTGQRAVDYVEELSDVISDLTGRFNCALAELPKRVESLQEEVKKLQKQIQKGGAGDLNTAGDKLLADAKEIKGAKLVVGEVPGAPVDAMRGQIDRLRQKVGSSLIVLGWKNEDGSAGLVVGVSEDLIKRGIKSNDVVKPLAEIIGGKGGGPPHLATAGGKDGNKLADALAKAVELGTGLLSR
ncbi:MAG TPA: alanine--tRNA ligase [Gemmataceae bacterium]|jgi:alanyl-tRNA synthetase|nr:alanine--tRNA ligase [Gemmataceae bacterium]